MPADTPDPAAPGEATQTPRSAPMILLRGYDVNDRRPRTRDEVLHYFETVLKDLMQNFDRPDLVAVPWGWIADAVRVLLSAPGGGEDEADGVWFVSGFGGGKFRSRIAARSPLGEIAAVIVDGETFVAAPSASPAPAPSAAPGTPALRELYDAIAQELDMDAISSRLGRAMQGASDALEVR